MASNRFQRAGKIGGRSAASERQKAIARQTILITRPWEKREYEVLIVLSNSPSAEAIEALYSEHGLKAMASISISSHGFLVSVVVSQRKDFSPSDIERIIRILESFKTKPN